MVGVGDHRISAAARPAAGLTAGPRGVVGALLLRAAVRAPPQAAWSCFVVLALNLNGWRLLLPIKLLETVADKQKLLQL